MPNAEQTQIKAQVDYYFYELKQKMRAVEQLQIKLTDLLYSSLCSPDTEGLPKAQGASGNIVERATVRQIELEAKLKERTAELQAEWNYATTIASQSKGAKVLWHAKMHGLTNKELCDKYHVSARQIKRRKWQGYQYFYRHLPPKYQN